MGRRLEDEIRSLEAEIDAFLSTQVSKDEVELEDWQLEAGEYWARGERIPDSLLEGKDELSAQFARILEQMRDEGYFDAILNGDDEGDVEDD